jgi:ribosomal protein L25 (general stress protein Ctc)
MRRVFMKKISVFITAVLMMSFIIMPINSVQAIGAEEIPENVARVIKNVEQTNKQINEEIEKAVYAAQEAFEDYNHDLMILQKGKELYKIDKELSKLENNLMNLKVGSKKYNAVLKNIERLMVKRDKIKEKYENKSLELKNTINELNLELNVADVANIENKMIEVDLRKTLEACDNVPNKNQEEIQRLEEKYIAEIDKIVNNLLEVTNKLAEKMIEDAAKEGVTVYCEWVEVTLGDRNILVDPLRIGNCFD